jgi:hypothetical protein
MLINKEKKKIMIKYFDYFIYLSFGCVSALLIMEYTKKDIIQTLYFQDDTVRVNYSNNTVYYEMYLKEYKYDDLDDVYKAIELQSFNSVSPMSYSNDIKYRALLQNITITDYKDSLVMVYKGPDWFTRNDTIFNMLVLDKLSIDYNFNKTWSKLNKNIKNE